MSYDMDFTDSFSRPPERDKDQRIKLAEKAIAEKNPGDFIAAYPEDTALACTNKLALLVQHFPQEEEAIFGLIDNRADVRAHFSNGVPLLFAACQYASVPVVRRMIEKGAKLNDVVLRYGGRDSGFSAKRKNIEDYLVKDTPVYYYVMSQLYPPKHFWAQHAENAIAEIEIVPMMAQKIMHVFNFASREKMTIVENTKTSAITVSPVSSFKDVAPERLQQAAAEMKKINPAFECEGLNSFGGKGVSFLPQKYKS